jgi:membrane fusion protein (multidrug efflux system)
MATPTKDDLDHTPVATPAETPSGTPAAAPTAAKPALPQRRRRRWWLPVLGVAFVGLGALEGLPWIRRAWTTVSTDDAYVNGHVTWTAPRVSGQVAQVLVDDNYRVKRGDLLVVLDKEPYQVQVNIARASVAAAAADLAAARAEARGIEGQMRSLRFGLQRAVEDVHNQVALLHSKVATLEAQQATVARAQADYNRALPLVASGAISKETFDLQTETLLTAQAHVEEARQGIYQVRVALGLPPQPVSGDDLAQTPPDLDETFSSVKVAQENLIQAAARLGVTAPLTDTPAKTIADFMKRDPEGNLERIYEKLLDDAPGVKQAESRLLEAQRNLDQAELNLRYCDVRAEIDGVVTRRNVNVGNNVIVGQNVLAIRSLTEIWIDANFKETQLAELRIGQKVDLEVDMYGGRRTFAGRITGFTMGTGSTLALLPPENATGNFVKVVQRLPVRIELTDYDPEQATLFVGLSVRPYVQIGEPATGPDAGRMLQAYGAHATPSDTVAVHGAKQEPQP